MKPALKNHLRYQWWIYLVAAGLITAIWITAFQKLAQPKANEQINITYIGKTFDHVQLQSDLYDVMPELSDQKIKRIYVEYAVIEGEYDLNTVLRARTAGSCDFFIVESTILEEYKVDLASYFAEVDVTLLKTHFENCGIIENEGKSYGIKLAMDSKLTAYYSGENVCNVFFNKNSVNLSDLFGGSKDNDAALRIIEYLSEVKDVQT